MKDKIGIGLIFLIVLVLLSVQQYFIWTNDNIDKDKITEKWIKKIELKIDSLNIKKDSVRTIIDSTHIKIVDNEKHYKEIIGIIIRQSNDSDSIFVSNYIRQWSDKNIMFDSCGTPKIN